jgi:hypothetical protein
MGYVAGLGMLLLMTSTSFADANASRFRIENGKIVIAQSACGICDNNRTSCVLACNGVRYQLREGAAADACREIWRLSPPRDDEAKQESDCEGLERRFARQVSQTIKGTARLVTRFNGIGDALACGFNGLSGRPNGFRSVTQLSRRTSARRFIFASHLGPLELLSKPIRWKWVGSSAALPLGAGTNCARGGLKLA